LYGLYVFAELEYTRACSSDLSRLAELIDARKLDPQIAMQASWELAGEAVEALLDRRVNGKAVLTVEA
jgi:NADPH:quinone reductase-like Zn-dependent oxidoreductase